MSPAKRTTASTAKAAEVLAEKARQDADRARVEPCPRCGTPTLTARAGRIAALDVRADIAAVTPIEEISHRLSGRLTWHLVSTAVPGAAPRITWRTGTHIAAGPSPHPVIADHVCPKGRS